jgi:hypothetical protein
VLHRPIRQLQLERDHLLLEGLVVLFQSAGNFLQADIRMDLVRFVSPNTLFKGLEVFFAAALGSLGETVLELALLLGVSRGSGGEVEEGGGQVDSM